MVKISVIVPVYNVEKYLRKCLDSLVNQTLKDIEIIIVNDGTKDNCQIIIDEYEKKYPNVKALKKENGGLSSARNFGLKHATGDFVAFVDSDDTVEDNYLEILYNNIIDTKSDIAVVGYKVVNENDDITYYSTKDADLDDDMVVTYEDDEIIKELLLQKRIKNFVCKLYRREIVPLYPEGITYEDIVYNVKLMNKAKRIVYINSSLYNYLKRSDSITAVMSEKNLNDFACAIKERYDLINELYPNLILYNMYAFIESTIAISSKNLLVERKYKDIDKKVDSYIKIIIDYINTNDHKELLNMFNDYEKRCLELMKQNIKEYYDYIYEIKINKK